MQKEYCKGTNFRGVLNFAVFEDRTYSRNLIWGYVCACDLEIYVCAWAFVWLHDLNRILQGPVSDDLVIVAMTESPQQSGCLQNLLGVLPAPTNDAGSTAELPHREGRTAELSGGGPCHGPSLSLTDALFGHTHALLVT